MTWFRIDDGWWCHRKTLAVSDAAAGLWVKMGCYSSGQLTDGQVPGAVLPLLTKQTGEARASMLRELVLAGMLEEAPDGYQMHDFGRYNPSRKEVLAERDRKAAAGRKGGVRSGESRKHHGEAPASPLPKHPASEPPKHAAKPRPVPSRPVPTVEKRDARSPEVAPEQTPEATPPVRVTLSRGDGVRVEATAANSRLAKLAKWHREAMAELGRGNVPPDLQGAGMAEPHLAHLDDPDAQAVVRDFVASTCWWAAEQNWRLGALNASEVTRIAVERSQQSPRRRRQITAAEIEALDTPPEPPEGWAL